MSAIWGIINKKGCDVSALTNGMSEAMSRYKIDRTDSVFTEKAGFVCGHQYITNEAVSDVSPIKDNDGFVFTGDCFLYNRDKVIELIENSGYSLKSAEALKSCGDAELSYHAFKALGFNFVKSLRGAFSFSIYDEKENKLHLYTEHFCKRYLCYYITDEYLCFASTYKPIMAIAGDKLKASRRFIVKSYIHLSPLNFAEPETTVFEGISHLGPAMHYTIDIASGNIEKEQYWTPRTSIGKFKGKSLDECKELFLDTFRYVARTELRARKETGIMLSGGLDSSAVMALTAPYLREQGKTIYSYTTTPSPGYKAEISYNIIENETFLVKEQQRLHPNHEPRFLSSENYNVISFQDEFQKIFDIPVKAVINMSNIKQMLDQAVKDNCSIVLSGSNGNPTISYGSIDGYISLAVKQGHFSNAIKEANAYCKRVKISRAGFLGSYIKGQYKYLFKTRKDDYSYLKPDDYDKYDVKHFWKNEKKEIGAEFHLSERQKRNFMFIPKQYIQKSYYYTIWGLEYGFLQLDPTLTVEMTELCMALPDECYVHNGVERYLVRGFMKDLIPELITDPRKGYGVQASDFIFRLGEDWDKIKDEVYSLLNEPLLKEYLNEEVIASIIKRVSESNGKLDSITAWEMVNLTELSYYLRGHKQYL